MARLHARIGGALLMLGGGLLVAAAGRALWRRFG